MYQNKLLYFNIKIVKAVLLVNWQMVNEWSTLVNKLIVTGQENLSCVFAWPLKVCTSKPRYVKISIFTVAFKYKFKIPGSTCYVS